MTRKIFFGLFCLFSITINAQETFNVNGCAYDSIADGKAPFRATLLSRDYQTTPSAYSLKEYCPEAKSQGQYGTCTSWATTYAARTICEALANGWTDKSQITDEAFAPLFVYRQIQDSVGCDHGSSIARALELLKNIGVPKFTSFDVWCCDYVPTSLFPLASQYKIDGYSKLFDSRYNYLSQQWDNQTSSATKISSVKKAISQNHPVIIAMGIYHSFDILWGMEYWNGIQDTRRGGSGGHAMCVVGYDDNMHGGAFEIMNSWGTKWGSNGFIWVSYDDFAKNVPYAYDMYVKKKLSPIAIDAKKNQFSGNMYIYEKDGGGHMAVDLVKDSLVSYYKAKDSYMSGKKFRLYVSNNEPAWVYVIASDLSNNVEKLFPYADNISASLDYKQNNIAIPDETHEFQFDTNIGTDYFCILYSQNELDINAIITKIKKANGSFYEKITSALPTEIANKEDITYSANNMQFTAETNGTVVPLIVEISHE